MVFYNLIYTYKFVTIMKYTLNRKVTSIFLLPLAICLFFSFENYIQLFNPTCGEDIHGIGQVIIDCNEGVTITSLAVDGDNGTQIVADITSDEKIRILPGTTSVRILPGLDNNLNKTITGKGIPDLKRSKLGGNGGKDGDKRINEEVTATFNYTINNGYLTILDLSSPIAHYSIYDINGILITNVEQLQPIDYQIPITHLQQGIYIIKVQLQNGDILTKTISLQ